LGGKDQEGHGLKPAWVNSSQDPTLKKLFTNGAGRVAQVVEHLPSQCGTMSSIPRTTKKKKKLSFKSLLLGAGMVGHTCNISYTESRGRRTLVQSWPWVKVKKKGKSARLYLKNNSERNKEVHTAPLA
jgi:hypothetical protein